MRRAFILLLFPILASAQSPAPEPDPLLSESRPSIRVLKTLHESELFPVMNVIADSLGVHCDYCHVKTDKWQWQSDEKKPKAVGLDMMKMVVELNASRFGGAMRVNCYTCHRGSREVPRVVPLPPIEVEQRQKKPPQWPSAEQLLERYRKAVGTPFASVLLKGSVERSENRSGTLEVLLEGESHLRTTFTGADGPKVQEANATEYPQPLAHAVMLYGVVKLPKITGPVKVIGTARIAEHETHIVSANGGADELYFDAQSGLLLRHVHMTETAFMPLPEQVDYDDYRTVSGAKVPFFIRTSDGAPYDTSTRRFTEIQSLPAKNP
ncbi:MAG TPA: photosynthetic reaction center cytochrome c subunit family protein [Thermoanaerobaculia bacterium]|nr:photosynthetic reaction center cytochrome c subunit family protein [Thermoanaerobaculia bacterium]